MVMHTVVATRSSSREFYFIGDEVRLVGQVDYPVASVPTGGFPLLFTLHHAGLNTREDYGPYAELALRSGFAVFRWDKRGSGRSGASGRGSATQDAVNAYETALDQPNINRKRVLILAVGSGTALLGASFGLFARAQRPAGALLIANMLDERAVVALDTRLKILMSDEDWNPWQTHAQEACAVHLDHYPHGASYYVAHDADRLLLTTTADGVLDLHTGARKVIRAWLDGFS